MKTTREVFRIDLQAWSEAAATLSKQRRRMAGLVLSPKVRESVRTFAVCRSSNRICGQALYVPIVESPGKTGIGRFGWKDQHPSLLSFAADAYINEMGITNRLIPSENASICNTVSEPNDKAGQDGLGGIDHFARFIRATKVPR